MIDENFLDSLVTNSSIWEPEADGFRVYASLRDHPAGAYDLVQDATLRELHPNLPEAMRLQAQEHEALFGIFVKRMLTIWSNDAYVVNTDGKNVSLNSVKDIKLTQRYLRIQSSGLYFKEVLAADGESVLRLPLDSASKMTTVSREWMSSAYPGWETRYKLALDLELDINATIRTICETSTTTSSKMVIPVDFTF